MKKENVLKVILIILTIVMVILFVYVLLNHNEEGKEKEKEEEKIEEIISYAENAEIKLDVFDYFKYENTNQNMVYSPLSINYAINMLYDGANGNTKTQLDTLRRDVTKYNNYEKNLNIANALFVKPDFSVKETYTNNLKNRYNATISKELNVTAINNWVKENTLGLIEKGIDRVDEDMVTFLINAVAIDMEWEHALESAGARNFNGKEHYQFLHETFFNEDVLYSKEDNAVVLPLKQYGDNKLEVLLVMPENLPEFINKLTIDDINKIDNNLKNTKDGLNLFVPKFKYDYQLDFKNDLIKQGITDIFTYECDLTNIAEGVYVDDAIHKATIDFSELGVKAAAITGFAMKNSAFTPPKDTITFDKPFMYIIRDTKTKDIWFVGKVYEPTKAVEE